MLMLLVCNHFVYLFHSLLQFCKQSRYIVRFVDTTVLGCAISTVTDSSLMFSLSHVFIVWTKSHYCYACWYNSARLCNFNRDRLLPHVGIAFCLLYVFVSITSFTFCIHIHATDTWYFLYTFMRLTHDMFLIVVFAYII